jgi:glycerol transport system substrate-binding protein
MDQVMARMQAVDEAKHVYHDCGPRLNEESDPAKWLSTEHAPWAKLDNEKPKGETVAYDELIKRWSK